MPLSSTTACGWMPRSGTRLSVTAGGLAACKSGAAARARTTSAAAEWWRTAGMVSVLSLHLFGNLTDHPARVPRGEHPVGDVPCDHAAGTDHGLRADPHARTDDCPAAHPH